MVFIFSRDKLVLLHGEKDYRLCFLISSSFFQKKKKSWQVFRCRKIPAFITLFSVIWPPCSFCLTWIKCYIKLRNITFLFFSELKLVIYELEQMRAFVSCFHEIFMRVLFWLGCDRVLKRCGRTMVRCVMVTG